MFYRVRYMLAGMSKQETESVEAHSPSEAMIKFDLGHRKGSLPSGHTITSVCAEETLLDSN